MEQEIERRSGLDTRLPEQKEQQGERRVSVDRRAPRRRILKGVRVSFGNDFCAVEGVLRDISETGAMIRLKDGVLVPDDLVIYNELDGYKVSCQVVRRLADAIGVKFTSEKVAIEAKRHQVVNMIGLNDQTAEADLQTDLGPAEVQQREPVGANKPRFGQNRPRFGKLGN